MWQVIFNSATNSLIPFAHFWTPLLWCTFFLSYNTYLFLVLQIFLLAFMLSLVQPFLIPRTIAHQTLLSIEFSGQEYWSGLPFPPPGDLPNPGSELMFPAYLLIIFNDYFIFAHKCKLHENTHLCLLYLFLV